MNSNIDFVQFTDVNFEVPSQASGLLPEIKGNTFNAFKVLVILAIVVLVVTAIIFVAFKPEKDQKEENEGI